MCENFWVILFCKLHSSELESYDVEIKLICFVLWRKLEIDWSTIVSVLVFNQFQLMVNHLIELWEMKAGQAMLVLDLVTVIFCAPNCVWFICAYRFGGLVVWTNSFSAFLSRNHVQMHEATSVFLPYKTLVTNWT